MSNKLKRALIRRNGTEEVLENDAGCVCDDCCSELLAEQRRRNGIPTPAVLLTATVHPYIHRLRVKVDTDSAAVLLSYLESGGAGLDPVHSVLFAARDSRRGIYEFGCPPIPITAGLPPDFDALELWAPRIATSWTRQLHLAYTLPIYGEAGMLFVSYPGNHRIRYFRQREGFGVTPTGGCENFTLALGEERLIYPPAFGGDPDKDDGEWAALELDLSCAP